MSHSPAQLVIALARFLVGATATMYGLTATFGIWGGSRLLATPAALADATPLAASTAETLLANLLLLCGVLLLLGLLTRTCAGVLLVLTVWHGLANGRFSAFFATEGGCEHVLFGAVMCAVLVAHGPGAYVVKFSGGKSGTAKA